MLLEATEKAVRPPGPATCGGHRARPPRGESADLAVDGHVEVTVEVTVDDEQHLFLGGSMGGALQAGRDGEPPGAELAATPAR